MAVISISPSSPSSQTPVTITLLWYGCYRDAGFERAGDTFNAFYDRESRCTATAPAGYSDIHVGLLHAGTYTVRYEQRIDGAFAGVSTLDFAVVAAPLRASSAPAIDIWSGCALVLALAIGAAVHRRRAARQ
jgi:hypothetical protein